MGVPARKIPSELMTPLEVADVFGVATWTVARWSEKGYLPSVRTLGGHRRYRREDVLNLKLNTVRKIRESYEQ